MVPDTRTQMGILVVYRTQMGILAVHPRFAISAGPPSVALGQAWVVERLHALLAGAIAHHRALAQR